MIDSLKEGGGQYRLRKCYFSGAIDVTSGIFPTGKSFD